MSGDFGDLEQCQDVSNKHSLVQASKMFEQMQILEGEEGRKLKLDSFHSKNVRDQSDITIPIPASDKFMYYISQMDTTIVFEKSSAVTDDLPASAREKDCGITYASIGGFSAQLEAIRETIELPLKYPDLFRECGWYSDSRKS